MHLHPGRRHRRFRRHPGECRRRAARQGATEVYAYITHGVLSGGAVARITASRLKELVITDSIQPTEAVRVARNIRVLSIATLIGEAIGRTARRGVGVEPVRLIGPAADRRRCHCHALQAIVHGSRPTNCSAAAVERISGSCTEREAPLRTTQCDFGQRGLATDIVGSASDSAVRHAQRRELRIAVSPVVCVRVALRAHHFSSGIVETACR